MNFVPRLADSRRGRAGTSCGLKGVLPNGHEKSVAATLLRSVRNLEAEGQDLLRMAASLAAAPIPPTFVAATFARVDGIERSRRAIRAAIGYIAS